MKILGFRHIAVAASAILVAGMLSQSLYAQTAKEVGYVESLTEDASNYVIERGNAQLPVALFTRIFAGDRIIIIPDDSETPTDLEIVLRIGQNKKQIISTDQSPFVVPDTIESISISKNLFSWLKDFFLLLHEEEISRVVTMTVRGDAKYEGPPSFILISKGEKVTAQFGHPLLYIEWTGGMPPFEFDVYHQGENVLALGSDAIGASSLISCLDRKSDPIVKRQHLVHRLELPTNKLGVGDYVIHLNDALGNVVVGQLTIVPRGTDGSSTEGEKTPEHLTALVTLVSAIKSGKEELLFDARQLIGDFSVADYPARLLGRTLICQSIQR